MPAVLRRAAIAATTVLTLTGAALPAHAAAKPTSGTTNPATTNPARVAAGPAQAATDPARTAARPVRAAAAVPPTISAPATASGYQTIAITGTAAPGATVQLYESAYVFHDL